MRIRDGVKKVNTGLDAIKRAPIVDYDTGVKCLRIQDISQNNNYDSWGFTKVSDSDFDKFRLKKNDILIARTGATVGVSTIINNDQNAVHNNGTIKLRTNNLLDSHFLYYIFQTKGFLEYIDNVSSVATQPNLRIEGLLRFSIRDYSKKEQKSISKILSRYDELINNNNQRIKLLEQMVENIYKEWFVRFRFPGWKETEFEEKQPRGWHIGNKKKYYAPREFSYGELKELGEFVRGKNLTAAQMKEGNIPVISAGLKPSGYHNDANVFGVNLTISASGANAGYLKYNLGDIWAADCSYYQNDDNIWFVYNTLEFLQPVISNLQAGSAQPHVYPKHVNRLSVLIPTQKLLVKFNEIASDIYKQIQNLERKNRNLITQRDLLLPRLMSGKLEVK